MNEKASTKNDHIFDPKKPEWLNGPTNFKINFEQFSDKDLYNYCKKVGFNARTWSRRFMATIPEEIGRAHV